MKKKFSAIISGLKFISIYGNQKLSVSGITNDSRRAKNNFIYIAIVGNKLDGHAYIDDAIENGACLILCSKIPKTLKKNITYVLVKNTRLAQGIISSNFYNNPSKKINLIMITGTNGKTTVVTLFYNLFKHLNYKVGMLTTIENKIDEQSFESRLTTPDSIEINYFLDKMVEKNCKYCFMEASSHAIDQNRIYGLKIKGAILTNISHDHIDYHSSFKDYIETKKKLFDMLESSSFALVNKDDKRGEYMLQNCNAKKYTYGIKKASDFKAKIISNSIEGLKINIEDSRIFLKLFGEFNAYNILCIYAGSNLLGINKNDLLINVSNLESPKGRFELLKSKNGVMAIIDYAHTPDALENVLKTINKFSSNNQIITVFGAGGDRDKTKRPLMGAIAEKYSDLIVLTSDNPRHENPQKIIDDIKKGIIKVKKLIQNSSRERAIQEAFSKARSGDIILIAGKGHENYQEIKGKKHSFDDKLVVNKILNL